jgi:hypothetical protein
MKRVLVLFLFIVAIVGSIYAWMIFRPSPEALLKTSIRSLINTSVTSVQWNTQWETLDQSTQKMRFGGWVSYAGTMDFRDPTLIQANGALGYSPTTNEADFETANIILTRDRFAFQEKRFLPERSNWTKALAGTSTTPETWLSVDRKTLLEIIGTSNTTAQGTGSGLRSALRKMDIYEWLTVTSSSEQMYAGREYMQIRMKVNEQEFSDGLLSIVTEWKKATLTSDEILSLKRIAKDVASGELYVMVDERAGDVVSMVGTWKMFDERGVVAGKVSFSVVFGVGSSITSAGIVIPTEAIDVTQALLPKKSGSLPSSIDRISDEDPHKTPDETEIDSLISE